MILLEKNANYRICVSLSHGILLNPDPLMRNLNLPLYLQLCQVLCLLWLQGIPHGSKSYAI
jgi:hypothetical protein